MDLSKIESAELAGILLLKSEVQALLFDVDDLETTAPVSGYEMTTSLEMMTGSQYSSLHLDGNKTI